MNILSLSLLFATASGISGCSCNADKVKVTFVTEGNSDIIRYVKRGKTLEDIPQAPAMKGKYCIWEDADFENIQKDMIVKANCFSTVTNLSTNMPSVIDVDIDSPEADLDYILKDMELEATFESGEKKKLYKGDYKIETNGYDKSISGSYTINIIFNNAQKNININVNKIKNYVTVFLENGTGYYSEGLPTLYANTEVEGSVVFDNGQSLYVGTKSYSWTFTPKDTNKYDFVTGKISVNLIKASSISTNKSSLRVGFGSSKNDIIAKIKEGLVVEAAYGSYYRQIDERYYSINSTEFVANRSGLFKFRVSYDSQIYYDIDVTVEKSENYSLDVSFSTVGTGYVYSQDDTLEDIQEYLNYEASISGGSQLSGTIAFVSGQTLTSGTHSYGYVFTPTNTNYAPRFGEIIITV